MARKLERPAKARKVLLFDDNVELLQRYFPKVGYNGVVREIVDKFCRGLSDRLDDVAAIEQLVEQEIEKS